VALAYGKIVGELELFARWVSPSLSYDRRLQALF
jgi:hypothetical protein